MRRFASPGNRRRAITALGGVGIAVNEDHVVDQIDDPVLTDSRLGVKPLLEPSVAVTGSVGDLDQREHVGRIRMASPERTLVDREQRQVGFRLRVVQHDDGF